MRALVIFALALLLAVGCSVSAGDASPAGPAGMAGTSSGGEPNGTALPTSLLFEEVGELAAREQIGLTLRASPPGVYHVRFALPSDAGDPLDASLDRSEADTDANGVATVVLTAPSDKATFTVRASVENRVMGRLTLSVKDSGFAVVQVHPSYPSLLRDPTTWIATAHPNKTCADVPGIPPPDGPLQATLAAKGDEPTIPRVPAGTPLAVTLRSGHFVGGCTSVALLPPGPTPQLVEVAVLNRPIDLSASTLAISLGLNARETTWSGLLTSTESEVLAALPGTSTDDVDMLLDAMRDASGSDRQAFEAARKAEGWDGLVKSTWGASASSKLTELVKSWLASGRDTFGKHEQPLLEGTIAPGGSSQSSAHLTLLKAAGLEPEHAGFASPTLVTWSASSDDTVTIGTDVYVVASELATALAEQAALAASGTATTAVEALDETVDCSATAAVLVAAGNQPALAYGTCGAACLESSCLQALNVIWQRGSAATGLDPARLIVTATGQAHVGDAAEVAGMGGSWLGDLRGPSGMQKTGGNLTATATAK